MGVTYGKITAPRAPFERIRLQPVEIRTYPPAFVAEVMCNDAETEEASELLMNYIGFSGMPHNVKAAQLAPADPVVPVSNVPVKIDLIVPVLREDHSMMLLLPEEYTTVDAIPVSTDPRVAIRPLPERTVAVQKFKGPATRKEFMYYVRLLQSKLEEERMLGVSTVVASVPAVIVDTAPPVIPGVTKHELLSKPTEAELGKPRLNVPSDEANKWIVAQYNSHTTLPFLRKNEVWIELDVANTQVAKLLEKTALKGINPQA
eukprot:gene18364-20908_t